jgi:hypothetical protein
LPISFRQFDQSISIADFFPPNRGVDPIADFCPSSNVLVSPNNSLSVVERAILVVFEMAGRHPSPSSHIRPIIAADRRRGGKWTPTTDRQVSSQVQVNRPLTPSTTMKLLFACVLLSTLLNSAEAFSHSRGEGSSRSSSHLAASASASSRRDFFSSVLSIATTGSIASTMVLYPLPGVADVSDGNALPQGAAQFSRVLKVRAQLQSVAKRVTGQPSEIEKAEWDKIDDFLRTVYSAGEDMKSIAKGIYDPAKKTKADEDIKLLQSLVQVAQKPVSNRDAAGFGVVAAKADGIFEDFFDLLRDIPDEL